jgi:hypothetical protein
MSCSTLRRERRRRSATSGRVRRAIMKVVVGQLHVASGDRQQDGDQEARGEGGLLLRGVGEKTLQQLLLGS